MDEYKRSAFRRRAEQVIFDTVRRVLSQQRASEHVKKVQDRYPSLPPDALADILIRHAVRKTIVSGATSGVVVTALETLVAVPVPEASHKVASALAALGTASADLSYTTGVQMQLVLDVAHLYNAPYDADDEGDVWIILKAALGIKGTAKAGSLGRFIFTEAARKQFRRLLRTHGLRRGLQQFVARVAGPRVARYLAEKYLLRLIWVANIGIGAVFNRYVTSAVGKWAKVRAKTRASLFQQIDALKGQIDEPASLVLPLIYWVGTADDRLTDNVLTLYAQAAKRFGLTEDSEKRIATLIADRDDLYEVLTERLRAVSNKEARRLLFETAVTTAAVDLDDKDDYHRCLEDLSKVLDVRYSRKDLQQAIEHLSA